MNHNYCCKGKRVLLSPLLESDIEELRLLRNRENKYFLSQSEVSSDMQQQWYQRYLSKEDDIMFKISLLEQPEKFVGAVALYDIKWDEKKCEVGRLLIDVNKLSGNGIGTEALTLACVLALDELKMKEIVAECRKENKRILNVDKKVGLEIVGEDETVYFHRMTKDTIHREWTGV